jgi:hypothetical protein
MTFNEKRLMMLQSGNFPAKRGTDILNWAEVARRHVPGLPLVLITQAHNRASLRAALNRRAKAS